MNQEANAYYTITPESIARERERLYEKARYDEAQALYNAEKKGRTEGRAEGKADVARNLLGMGFPLEQIIVATGLTCEEIENLKT